MADDNGADSESKKIHPFFFAPKQTTSTERVPSPVRQPITPDPSCSPNSDRAFTKPDHPVTMVDGDDADPGDRSRKRRKIDSFADTPQPSKQGKGKRHSTSAGPDILRHFEQKEDSFAHGATETRTEQEEVNNTIQQDKLPMPLAQALQSTLNADHTAVVDSTTKQDSKPRKLLKLNSKTGTIGSPPKPKAHIAGIEQATVTTPKPLTKPRRNKKVTSRIVCIQYGAEDESARVHIAEKIEEILSGVRYIPIEIKPNGPASMPTSHSLPTANTTPLPANPGTPKKQPPSKVTHPFFGGKPKSATSVSAPEAKDLSNSPKTKHTVFTSTPRSPKQNRLPPPKVNLPQFGLKAGGLKIPGAQHPAWPWQGMVHIRGNEGNTSSLESHDMPSINESRKKAKGRQISLLANESLMNRTTSNLRLDELVEELKSLNTDDFQPPPPTLRIPGRHFESGKKLQARINSELHTIHPGPQARAHPAIMRAYNSLTTSLSAFDQSTCENISWTQKYCPTTADQVLQGGKEAELLRNWLHALKVQSVDTGTSEGNGSKPKAAPPKRRKRKKLDSFIVSSGEEDDEMDELSDAEGGWISHGGQGDARKTVIRNAGGKGSKDARLPNAVVLTGPHGCGKTAAVYAIAKELDFEVFEISPGARRNGKDILEKIGDMTRNHLVQHKQETSQPEEIVSDDEVARDLKSGKQGMMTAFFKPNANAKPVAAKPKPVKAPQPSVADKPMKKPAAKAQKQSLILLEEVDILYEEDKQFWATVISLMTQSKRPFIMTCNDESLVPFQNLNLYGIFRFKNAPTDLALDLLLLIAANEGHALRREAVQALYESRRHDLRASITELNYWCQIGVGDLKGGFGWFCRRWPEGSDIDKEGDRIRAVSAGTYQTGMGWFGRDAILSQSAYRTTEEEILRQSCENWHLDLGGCEVLADQHFKAPDASLPTPSRKDQLAILNSTDAFYDLMSAADLVSCGSYSSLNQVNLDPTLPELSNKVKTDFIIGRKILDVQTLARYDATSLEMAASMKNLARGRLSAPNEATVADTHILDELKATQQIQDSFRNPPYNVPSITRGDYSVAFDPIAASDKPIFQATGYLDPSVFDRTMAMLTLDVAPYVRSIVSYDQRLQAERLLRGSLLSEGGKPKKRVRTTRSAFSALEGGSRSNTRRERYFSANVNAHLVMYTGGEGWAALAAESTKGSEQSPTVSAQQSDDGEMDTSVDDVPGDDLADGH